MYYDKRKEIKKSRKRKLPIKKNKLNYIVHISKILYDLHEYKSKLNKSKQEINILDYSKIIDVIEREQTLLSIDNIDADIIKYEENFYTLFKKLYYLENINLLLVKVGKNNSAFLWNTEYDNFSKLYKFFIAFLDSLINNDIDNASKNLEELKNGFLYYSRIKPTQAHFLSLTPDLVEDCSHILLDSKDQLEKLKTKIDG